MHGTRMIGDQLANFVEESNSNDKNKWLEDELTRCELKDSRLRKRFRKLLEQLWNGLGKTIPFACQDWSNTKAAYRFLSNKQVKEHQILASHFQGTKERAYFEKDPILILQDTTEFSYQREDKEAIGLTRIVPTNKDLFGKPIQYKKCGILMHSSMAITTKGLPLGLTAIKFWTRKQFKGANALKKHINPTRIPIEEKESYRWLENLKQSTKLLQEPSRCVHIGDRESDIYELFCLANELNTHFLVRTCVDRLIEDGKRTVADEMSIVEPKGMHQFEIQDADGNTTEIELEIRYQCIKVLPPIGKQKKYPSLTLTIIHAEEKETPTNRDKIIWKLATNLSVTSMSEAIEKLDWYTLRWRIETFHKILKSGCKAESSKLRTAQRLTNLIAIFCILSWRIFWMTIINRCSPNAEPKLAFTQEEISLLDTLITIKPKDERRNKNLNYYLNIIARLGGYLARKSDPPPGNMVMWRGFSRLTDIAMGYDLARK